MGVEISHADCRTPQMGVHELVDHGGQHKTTRNTRSDTNCASRQHSPVSASDSASWSMSRTSTKDTDRSVSPVSSNDSQWPTSPSSSATERGERSMSCKSTDESIGSAEFFPSTPHYTKPSGALLRDKGQETDKGLETKHGQEDGLMTAPPPAPLKLDAAFRPEEVQPWENGRFKHVRKLADAFRNKGTVDLVRDSVNNELVAMKRMPNTWCLNSHEEFLRLHPTESEFPWQDIGCTRFLNSVNFKYACNLEGVYRSEGSTFVATRFASEGDLFDVALSGANPASDLGREAALAPIVCQLFCGLKQLHDMQIAHRDISLENVLLTRSGPNLEVKIIDYSCTTTQRIFTRSAQNMCGKDSYKPPEIHTAISYDAFLHDAFAAGVLVYTLLLKDYPFQSTVAGVCKRFDFVRNHGFQEFCLRRTARGSDDLKIVDVTSAPLLELLEGLLSFNPKKRWTFGEEQWTDSRVSVLDNPWIQHYSDKACTSLTESAD